MLELVSHLYPNQLQHLCVRARTSAGARRTFALFQEQIMRTRMFRATFVDAYSQHTIVVEFEAPFPIDDEVDYKKLAVQRLGEMIRKDEVKVRDIEPIEI